MSATTLGAQIEADRDPAAELQEAFWRNQRSRIKLAGPAPNTRASSIGHPCDRHGFYERTVPAELRVPHTPELQAIFDLGNELETYADRKLMEMGVEIVQRGRDYADPRLQLSGHADARIKLPGWRRSLITEIKGLNPYTAESIQTLADIRNHSQAWVRRYYSQLQLYLYLAAEELGLFALLNKSTGSFRFLSCRIDYDHVEGLLKKAERIVLAVAASTPPPRVQSAECQRCAFAHVCAPDMHFGPGATVLDDGELEAKIKRRMELKPLAAEFDALDKELKTFLPPREGEVLVGDYVAIRRLERREGYSVEPTSFFRTEYRKLTK